MTRAWWRWAGMVATAPCVILLVALPVGFVMELGKQVRLRVVNRTDRAVRVTPLGSPPLRPDALRVAVQTFHPLLPLPALRAADLPLVPGATRVLHYSARGTALRALAVRDADGRLRRLPLGPASGRRDVEMGREVVLTPDAPLDDALPAGVVDGHSQLPPWAVLLAGPLGTWIFLVLYRKRPAAGVS